MIADIVVLIIKLFIYSFFCLLKSVCAYTYLTILTFMCKIY